MSFIFACFQMHLQILVALLIGAVQSINVPAATYTTYHGTSVHNPFSKQSYAPSSGNSYFGNYYGHQPYRAPTKVPSLMCPAATPVCQKSRYRTLDGTCNNMQNPLWGSANMRYSRLLTPRYGDGISAPTMSVTGQPLPNSRLVSLVVFGEADIPDPQFTIANMQWGQIMTHDMSMQAGGTQSSKYLSLLLCKI